MTDKLFTFNRKSILFNLIGFEHCQYFELARKIEQFGGKVSLPDEFSSEAMTIINTDICYSLEYIQDSIENGSLVEAQNYCLKHILESTTGNNNKKNNSHDELSSTTIGPEEDITNDRSDMFLEDKCLEESPDLLNVETDVTDEETDDEGLDETSDRNSSVMSETVVEEVNGRQSPSHSLENETYLEEAPDDVEEDPVIDRHSPMAVTQSDDNDDIVLNSDDETIKKRENHHNKKRLSNNRPDSSSGESSDDLRKKKKRKPVRLPLSSASDLDLNSDSEDKPGRSVEPLEKSGQSNKNKVVIMNKKVVLCSPPTSDDESVKIPTQTDKIPPKRKSIRNKELLNKVPEESNRPKASTEEELTRKKNNSSIYDFINEDNLPQKTAPDKTKSDKTNSSANLNDRVGNPGISSEAELIDLSHAKWLDDRKSIGDKIKNAHGIKGGYYEMWEETGIFWWLIKNNKINQVRNEMTFKKLIEDGYLTHRTGKGLFNHFRRQMLRKLNAFELPQDVYKELKFYADNLDSI